MGVEEVADGNIYYAFLTEFGWDRDTPKPEHEHWASRHAGQIAALAGRVFVIGMADRSHHPNFPRYNQDLSERRARAVYRLLLQNMAASVTAQFSVQALGDTMAGGPADRWARDRTVLVAHIRPGVRVDPEWPGWFHNFEQWQPSRILYFRSVCGASIDLPIPGLSGSGFNLQISDGAWSQIYLAPGIDIGLSPVPFSFTGLGPWHLVRLHHPRSVDQFRQASVQVLNVDAQDRQGVLSYTILRIHNPEIRISPFGFGSGLGGPGGSTTVAVLQAQANRPFRGGPSVRAQQAFARGATRPQDD